MQTFMPYSTHRRTAKCLDRQRLGKQRVENLQIMKQLITGTGGWSNHPAVKQWANHLPALMMYHREIVNEWIARGYRDTCLHKAIGLYRKHGIPLIGPSPPWLGNDRLHASHRSNLLRKDPDHYGRFGWPEQNDMPYWWPTGVAMKNS